MIDQTATRLRGRDSIRLLLEHTLRRATADETELVLTIRRQSLTRFAENYVHQNVTGAVPELTVRSAFGRRVGTASTSRLDDEGLARVVDQAEMIARLTPESDRFAGLPHSAGDPGQAVYSSGTFDCPPEQRASLAGIACRLASEAGLLASGSVTTTGEEIAIYNSHDVFAYTPRSYARVVVVANGETGSGYGQDTALALDAIDAEAVAGRAVATALNAQQPVEIPPGVYTVILQPEAVADIITWCSFMGFGAQAVQEGRSFVTGKRGQRVLGEQVTIWDDGDDPAGLPLPFDYEGVPRRRLSLIDAGVADDIALDTGFAARMNLPNNGHATPVGGFFGSGPLATNLFMQPGLQSVEGLIRSTERGLLVTSFHYTRVVHPLYVILTGMTRHGTFLIEHGAVTRPVKNLRYTQSYLDALNDVQGISSETRLAGEWMSVCVPAVKVGAFTFTGVTQ